MQKNVGKIEINCVFKKKKIVPCKVYVFSDIFFFSI
jgi:hypothetical protein